MIVRCELCDASDNKFRGVARIFQRGGHTGSNNIVMAFSPRNIVGCLLKKGLTKGGSQAPQEPPSYSLEIWGYSELHKLNY